MSYASVAQIREYLTQVPKWGEQLITISGATGGGVKLDYEGTPTATLAYNAKAKQVQTELRAISDIGASGVKVTGEPGSPWIASFQGDLSTDAAPLTVGENNLTGTSPTITIVPNKDSLLQNCLDRATSDIREEMRSYLADSLFDFTAYGLPSTRIIDGYFGVYLTIPAHQIGSVTLVEQQITSIPATYQAITDQWNENTISGQLYRSAGWSREYYRITAVWGYGPAIPESIVELTLELAVNIWRSRDKGGFTDVIGIEGSGGIKPITSLNKSQQAKIENIANQIKQIWI